MKILHLTLKKRWFDLIYSGIKEEEYREIKPYWDKRLANKEYDIIKFKNGYDKNAPTMEIECKGITIGYGNTEWGASEDQQVYIIKLGKILNVDNVICSCECMETTDILMGDKSGKYYHALCGKPIFI